jgi:hypothetical protein
MMNPQAIKTFLKATPIGSALNPFIDMFFSFTWDKPRKLTYLEAAQMENDRRDDRATSYFIHGDHNGRAVKVWVQIEEGALTPAQLRSFAEASIDGKS